MIDLKRADFSVTSDRSDFHDLEELCGQNDPVFVNKMRYGLWAVRCGKVP